MTKPQQHPASTRNMTEMQQCAAEDGDMVSLGQGANGARISRMSFDFPSQEDSIINISVMVELEAYAATSPPLDCSPTASLTMPLG